MRFIILLLAPTLIFSGVSISSSIYDGSFRGDCVRTGTFSCSFTSDAIPNASEETPVYLRISFNSNNVKLSQTLVDLEQEQLEQLPILLALTKYNSSQPGNLAANPHTLSIVRWRKGENAIWLKISSPTSSWLSDGTQAVPLSTQNPVGFDFGFDLQENRSLSNRLPEQRNMAYLAALQEKAATTEIRLDLSQSSLELSGESSLLACYLDFFDHTTLGVENQETITLGQTIPITQFGSAYVLRATERPFYSKQIVAPWVSWNDQFDSELMLNNRDAASVDLLLTLRRADGTQSLLPPAKS